nr:hypothetical protein [Tanacetum cinerariifolium]
TASKSNKATINLLILCEKGLVANEPGNANVETKVESMVTIPIHQASSSVPPLSTPIIDLSPPKPVSSHEAVQIALQDSLRERFRDLFEADMKENLHQWMFESGSYRTHPEHASLYEALERSMDCDNREELLEEKAESRKRHRDDQDPHSPP